MNPLGPVGGTVTTPIMTELEERLAQEILNQLPEADRTLGREVLGSLLSDRPDLSAPLLASGLSLDVLVEAVGAEERKTAVKTSTESLKSKAEQRKAANDKALEEIQKRIETLAKEKALGPFQKFFKYLGMAIGAIASIATIALGAMTGNPLMIAAGVIMATLVVDSILSEATDGKVCISAGVTAAAKALGASEETAKWIAFGVTCALTVTSIALSFGSAAAANAGTIAAKVSSLATKVTNVMAKVQQASSVVSGVTAVGTGACQVAQAVLDYEIAESKARSKELQAILERIRESVETEEDFLKFVMEKFEGLLTSVSEIVKQSHEAQLAVQTGQAPLA